MRTALSVVLTCCPPAPCARMVSIFSSLGGNSIAAAPLPWVGLRSPRDKSAGSAGACNGLRCSLKSWGIDRAFFAFHVKTKPSPVRRYFRLWPLFKTVPPSTGPSSKACKLLRYYTVIIAKRSVTLGLWTSRARYSKNSEWTYTINSTQYCTSGNLFSNPACFLFEQSPING